MVSLFKLIFETADMYLARVTEYNFNLNHGKPNLTPSMLKRATAFVLFVRESHRVSSHHAKAVFVVYVYGCLTYSMFVCINNFISILIGLRGCLKGFLKIGSRIFLFKKFRMNID